MAGAEFKNGYKKGFEDGANSVEEGLPGWFGTLADMMTLLFAFFVLLAAISTMDPVKLQEMANSEGKSLGSKIKASGKAEEEGEFEPIKNLAEMKKEMEETIEEMKKENPKGDPPIDIQTSSKGLIVNIKGDYAFPIGKASMKEELKGLLDEEIIINDKKVKWIEVKNFYGSNVKHFRNSVKKQINRYFNKWGRGCIVYRYAYSSELNYDDNIIISF